MGLFDGYSTTSQASHWLAKVRGQSRSSNGKIYYQVRDAEAYSRRVVESWGSSIDIPQHHRPLIGSPKKETNHSLIKETFIIKLGIQGVRVVGLWSHGALRWVKLSTRGLGF